MDVTLAARHPQEFTGRVLVNCPRCGRTAEVTVREAMRRLVCEHCALTREARANDSGLAMGQPLRLRAETRLGVLYAFNEAHLDYIEAYVAGRLRREVRTPGGVRNQSVISRLPRWVKAAANREEVLKAIGRARARLDG